MRHGFAAEVLRLVGVLHAICLPVDAGQFHRRLHGICHWFSVVAHRHDLQRQRLTLAHNLRHFADAEVKLRAVHREGLPLRNRLLIEVRDLRREPHKTRLRHRRIQRNLRRDRRRAAVWKRKFSLLRIVRLARKLLAQPPIIQRFREPKILEPSRREPVVLRTQRPSHLRLRERLAHIILRGERHIQRRTEQRIFRCRELHFKCVRLVLFDAELVLDSRPLIFFLIALKQKLRAEPAHDRLRQLHIRRDRTHRGQREFLHRNLAPIRREDFQRRTFPRRDVRTVRRVIAHHRFQMHRLARLVHGPVAKHRAAQLPAFLAAKIVDVLLVAPHVHPEAPELQRVPLLAERNELLILAHRHRQPLRLVRLWQTRRAVIRRLCRREFRTFFIQQHELRALDGCAAVQRKNLRKPARAALPHHAQIRHLHQRLRAHALHVRRCFIRLLGSQENGARLPRAEDVVPLHRDDEFLVRLLLRREVLRPHHFARHRHIFHPLEQLILVLNLVAIILAIRQHRRRRLLTRDEPRRDADFPRIDTQHAELPRAAALLMRRVFLKIKPRLHRRKTHRLRPRIHLLPLRRNQPRRDGNFVFATQLKLAVHRHRRIAPQRRVQRDLQPRRLRHNFHKLRDIILLHRLAKRLGEIERQHLPRVDQILRAHPLHRERFHLPNLHIKRRRQLVATSRRGHPLRHDELPAIARRKLTHRLHQNVIPLRRRQRRRERFSIRRRLVRNTERIPPRQRRPVIRAVVGEAARLRHLRRNLDRIWAEKPNPILNRLRIHRRTKKQPNRRRRRRIVSIDIRLRNPALHAKRSRRQRLAKRALRRLARRIFQIPDHPEHIAPTLRRRLRRREKPALRRKPPPSPRDLRRDDKRRRRLLADSLSADHRLRKPQFKRRIRLPNPPLVNERDRCGERGGGE